MATLILTSVGRCIVDFPPADVFVGRRRVGGLRAGGESIQCELAPGLHAVALVESDREEPIELRWDQSVSRFELVVHPDGVEAPDGRWLDRFVASRWQAGVHGSVRLECRYTREETSDGGVIPAHYSIQIARR